MQMNSGKQLIVFDSRDENYRKPCGAVKSNQIVEITARPESFRFPLRGFLCLHYESMDRHVELKMKHEGLKGDFDLYTAEIDTTGYIGLIYYYFRFENDGGGFYYGNNRNGTGGRCEFYGNANPIPYQLTVYDENKIVPKWFGEGITYHIFPDRFCRLETPSEDAYRDRLRRIHENWDDNPDYGPVLVEGKEVWNRDFFGGSLKGIESKLGHLQKMGVSCIYLSPIFESFSNHRYDTADYMKIDPLLGTEHDFKSLCAAAKEKGIRIILDGVFNHTGSDSVYFNKEGRYPEQGAYQSKDSKYYNWYSFERWPEKYSSWWGVKTLPQVNESEKSYIEFINRAEDSVIKHWLRAGASGWRLDVADELPDEFIDEIKKAALSEKDDAVIIGEVWEDASSKISYGKRRQYILKNMLDSVMNYPFRNAVIAYLSGGRVEDFREAMELINENYPKEVRFSLMNILGTHDTPRILTLLGDPAAERMNRAEKTQHRLNETQRSRAKKLLKLGAAIQYTYPGSPCVYYGDEAGMEGWDDPYNRQGYIWGKEDAELSDWYCRLGQIRNSSNALTKGEITFLKTEQGLLVYKREYDGDVVLIAVNAGNSTEWFELDRNCVNALSGETVAAGTVEVKPASCLILQEN